MPAAEEAPTWFLHKYGQRTGPYTFAHLQQQVSSGQLAPTDPVWREGMDKWAPASSVPGLFSGMQPGVPVAPPALVQAAQAPAPRLVGTGLWAKIKFELQRAFEWNLRQVLVTPTEEQELIAVSVDDSGARQYHAWRRSVLRVVGWASLTTAVLGLIGFATEDRSGYTEVGNGIEFLRMAVLFVMPSFAFIAARAWKRHRRSRRLLVEGWVIAFVVPLLLALIPLSWQVNVGGEGSDRGQVEAMLGLLGAIEHYVTLMPAVLALIPGIMRACLRVKVLLPESILPGWFLVSVSPIFVALFLVIFATVNQVAGDALLILGVLAITAAPVLYLVHVKLFSRPLASAGDQATLHKVQKQVRLLFSIGIGLVLIWAFAGHVFGKHIIGFDAAGSLVRPWNAHLFKFPLEFGSHSLFTMAVVADLIMSMNLSVWQHTKKFVGSDAAAEYDRTMSEIEEAGARD